MRASIRSSANLHLGYPSVDELARNAQPRRYRRQGVRSEPARLDDLYPVDANVAAGVVRGEPDHQRMREGPRLASEIPDASHLDADLLAHLARERIFERLADLDEPGQRAEPAVGRARVMRQKGFVSAADEHDDGRRDSRVG